MKKNIPNLITGLNMFSGCMAVTLAFYGFPLYAAMFILFGAIFDFCDGFAARLLKAYSDMGKELDSLADLITFGFAPAAIAYNMLSEIYGVNISGVIAMDTRAFILFIPFVMVVFSGFRLAKFNIDTRQTTSFLGLPTPANALFWASFPVIKAFKGNQEIVDLLWNPVFVIAAIVVFSLLLVSEIPMFSFKIKTLGLRENSIRYIFISALVVLFISLGLSAVVFIIPLYVGFSLLKAYVFKN